MAGRHSTKHFVQGGIPSEHSSPEGKLYLCAFKDVWSNRIVDHSIGSTMTSSPTLKALNNAAMESFFALLRKNVLDQQP